jgi:hypothetical protein
VRRKDGARFPNTSLVSILAGLNAILFGNMGIKSLFRDGNFKPIICSLDASMKISTQSGAGLHKASADYITVEEEYLLWNGGFLSHKGIHFGLRGGDG